MWVVREAVEPYDVTIDGSAVVAPTLFSAVAVLLVSLAGWHGSFAGSESLTTRTRSHQVADLAVLAPLLALTLAATWALFVSRPAYPASALIAATMLPLLPGVAVAAFGELIATLSRSPISEVVGTAFFGLGLLTTAGAESALFGWAFLSACLFVTSRTLSPPRRARAEIADARA